eukprot:m.168907 g.168907  ORF g.168907 m.168907 type:complete len:247 (-) comp14761_c0_seq1:680-1420(-)
MQRLITPAAVAVTVCLAIAPDATALPPSRPIAPEPTIPPDTSLDTLPVAYYGAQWTRDDDNIDLLSRMQIVMLMQEEGPCWKTCCPYVGTPTYPNHRCNGSINASTMKGCDPSCDRKSRPRQGVLVDGRRTACSSTTPCTTGLLTTCTPAATRLMCSTSTDGRTWRAVIRGSSRRSSTTTAARLAARRTFRSLSALWSMGPPMASTAIAIRKRGCGATPPLVHSEAQRQSPVPQRQRDRRAGRGVQ